VTDLLYVGSPVMLQATFLIEKTVGNIEKGTNTLMTRDASGYLADDPIVVRGGGDVDGDLWTTIASISGNVMTLNSPAGSTVIRGEVGKLVTPTSVAFTVRQPDDSEATGSAGPVRVGVYEAQFVPSMAGRHTWEMVGSGSVAGRADGEFTVEERETP
jgi:hypothetical protein